MRHTKLPWRVDSGMIVAEDGTPIAKMDRTPGNGTTPTERDENAQYIVRACNAHESMVHGMKALLCLVKPDEMDMPHTRAALRALDLASGTREIGWELDGTICR